MQKSLEKSRLFAAISFLSPFYGRGRRIQNPSVRCNTAVNQAHLSAHYGVNAALRHFAGFFIAMCATKHKKDTYLRVLLVFGRGRRIRTRDPRFWRPVLYQLSYTPVVAFRYNAHYYITFFSKLQPLFEKKLLFVKNLHSANCFFERTDRKGAVAFSAEQKHTA